MDDINFTSSLAAHFPTPWEPVYASSKWAINCLVRTVRRQVIKHRYGRVGFRQSSLLADWPEEKFKETKNREVLSKQAMWQTPSLSC
ncbi:hypothetical protein SBC1_02810 [Caballeronia sp. SBC1]|nr:hypothetical protein [Caballeronia sp. SBC1]QIN60306.1 hypothetical protein SBC1_02810 [Caballeronia sp. SBC1]